MKLFHRTLSNVLLLVYTASVLGVAVIFGQTLLDLLGTDNMIRDNHAANLVRSVLIFVALLATVYLPGVFVLFYSFIYISRIIRRRRRSYPRFEIFAVLAFAETAFVRWVAEFL